ncbi:DNA-directed RNA polymerase II subunit 4 isoform X2 [Amborella trichopoda]|uniref:DNA-directed RNA polymerase II subunit 4 isoform X2 n=1 Tax=Amborella trichopoda TaxID=13333 RepID=UPI0005D41004|nr:DNA-directed RNA polymerase II subunit 4 isoform X2 [Amborella trichopoda]|eukprot:XP_011628250.1 DNA-directed RNA polymerase II subunit 4 isoform X2 [Amborella trichopoda]
MADKTGKSSTPISNGGKASSKFKPVAASAKGKATTAKGKENWDKAGKAGKGGSSREGKKSAPVVELNIEQELPSDSRCLMDCEAAIMLERIEEQLRTLSNDPAIKIPQSFNLGLKYAKSCTYYKKPESVKQVRELLGRYQLSDVESCLIANAHPETVEEVYSFVPSFKAKKHVSRGSISKMLFDLAEIESSQQGSLQDP